MTRSGGGLAAFREIAVVLGGGLLSDGLPTVATVARAEAAAALARTRMIAIIVSGSHGNGPPPPRTEAEHMAERIVAGGVERSRIFLEGASRDTVSNVAFVAERYLAALAPRRLVVVTSAFHIPRALATFALVLGERWPLEAHPVPDTPGAADRAAGERRYLERTFELLADLTPGDIAAIAERVRTTLHRRVRDTE